MDRRQPANPDAPRSSPEQALRTERRRMVRERWMHLLLLGFAISVIVHVGIMLRLWWVKLPGRLDAEPAPVELRLQTLPPQVEVPPPEVELPDPSPQVAGEITPEPDELPNLSTELASDNPSADSYGALEAPGVGAIVGPGGAGSGIGIGSGKGGGGTSFFGVGGRGSRFAFIVDVSGSMEQENRIGTALAELKRSVAALPDYTQFFVVLYASEAIKPPFVREGWQRANRSNVARLRQWLDGMTPQGGTVPLPAFEAVFALEPGPDVIFFLTDGEIPPDTVAFVNQLARECRTDVSINTIGFSSQAGREPLIEIARSNRGVFRFVPSAMPAGGGAP